MFALPPSGPSHDLVILGGQVLDPASGTYNILNIGVRDGTIVAMTSEPIKGKREIDASGRTVAPGFIDLHTHTPFPYGELFQVKDGVTTALDLEAGASPVMAYGQFIKGKARANFGASVGHFAIRIKVIEGKDQPYIVTRNGQILPGGKRLGLDHRRGRSGYPGRRSNGRDAGQAGSKQAMMIMAVIFGTTSSAKRYLNKELLRKAKFTQRAA